MCVGPQVSGWLSVLSRFLCRLFIKMGQNSVELNVCVSASPMYVRYIMQGRERQVKAEERDRGTHIAYRVKDHFLCELESFYLRELYVISTCNARLS